MTRQSAAFAQRRSHLRSKGCVTNSLYGDDCIQITGFEVCSSLLARRMKTCVLLSADEDFGMHASAEGEPTPRLVRRQTGA